MRMIKKRKLQWWVPLRHQAQQARHEIAEVFSRGVLVRIVLVVIGIFIAAAYLLPQHIPDLEFDWLSAFFKCMGALVAILLMCCAIAFVPPLVTVSPKGIVVSQGQHAQHYPYTELAELRIEDSVSPYPMLLLRLRSQHEPKRYPVSPKIVLDDLRALIAEHKPK